MHGNVSLTLTIDSKKDHFFLAADESGSRLHVTCRELTAADREVQEILQDDLEFEDVMSTTDDVNLGDSKDVPHQDTPKRPVKDEERPPKTNKPVKPNDKNGNKNQENEGTNDSIMIVIKCIYITLNANIIKT